MGFAAKTPAQRRATARTIAVWFAVVASVIALTALVLGEVGVFGPRPGSAPDSTVDVVTQENVVTTNAETLDTENNVVPTESTVTTPESTVTTTTTTADNSLIGIGLSNPASRWIVEGLLVLLIGFLTGLVAQRVYLGEYGFSLGTFKVDALSAIDEKSAAKALAPITAGDIPPVQGITGSSSVFWWQTIDPPLNGTDGFIVYRAALESAVRELAGATGQTQKASIVAIVDDIRRALSLGEPFAMALVRLLEIGDQIVDGAQVESKAVVKLRSAYQTALTKIRAAF